MYSRGRMPVSSKIAPDRDLRALRALPHSTDPTLDLRAHSRREQGAQLLEQVKAGAVDDVVVADALLPVAARVVVHAHSILSPHRGDVRDPSGDEPAVVVVGDRPERRRIEHPPIAVAHEVTSGLLVKRIPTDLVGI